MNIIIPLINGYSLKDNIPVLLLQVEINRYDPIKIPRVELNTLGRQAKKGIINIDLPLHLHTTNHFGTYPIQQLGTDDRPIPFRGD